MENRITIWTYLILIGGVVFVLNNSCKKEEPFPDIEEVKFGPTSTYTVLPGNSLHDTISGYDFVFGTTSATSNTSKTVSICKIISEVDVPFDGKGFKIEYTGDDELFLRIISTNEDRIVGLMYGFPDGLYNGDLIETWIGMPVVSIVNNNEYFFSLPQYYNLKSTKRRGANLFWFDEIKKTSTDAEKMQYIQLQARTFLDDYYINSLNPSLKSSVIAAYNAKTPTYAWGNKSFYQAFWKPLGYLAKYIYHPTINFEFKDGKPTAEDIAHEEAHYFINLVVGDEVQKILDGQGAIFDNHGKNDVVGRGYVVDEFVYFTETTAGYQTNELEEPSAAFKGKTPMVTDIPSIEGFGGTMLYTLVRTKPTIQNLFLIKQQLDFPVIGLSYGQVFDIIAQGATDNNKIRENIQKYIFLHGTPDQNKRFQVALQRIGWSYSVKGTLVDPVKNEPLEGYAIENIIKSDGGIEYSNGEGKMVTITKADGSFRLFGTAFPGSSILRFTKDGKSTDVVIDCPYNATTNTINDLKTVKLISADNTSSDLIAKIKLMKCIKIGFNFGYVNPYLNSYEAFSEADGYSWWDMNNYNYDNDYYYPINWSGSRFSIESTMGDSRYSSSLTATGNMLDDGTISSLDYKFDDSAGRECSFKVENLDVISARFEEDDENKSLLIGMDQTDPTSKGVLKELKAKNFISDGFNSFILEVASTENDFRVKVQFSERN